MQFAWAVEKSRFSFSAMALRFLCLPSIYQKEVKTQALIAAKQREGMQNWRKNTGIHVWPLPRTGSETALRLKQVCRIDRTHRMGASPH
jgi:hypothetical protein